MSLDNYKRVLQKYGVFVDFYSDRGYAAFDLPDLNHEETAVLLNELELDGTITLSGAEAIVTVNTGFPFQGDF
jgi:hypothetical protein